MVFVASASNVVPAQRVGELMPTMPPAPPSSAKEADDESMADGDEGSDNESDLEETVRPVYPLGLAVPLPPGRAAASSQDSLDAPTMSLPGSPEAPCATSGATLGVGAPKELPVATATPKPKADDPDGTHAPREATSGTTTPKDTSEDDVTFLNILFGAGAPDPKPEAVK